MRVHNVAAVGVAVAISVVLATCTRGGLAGAPSTAHQCDSTARSRCASVRAEVELLVRSLASCERDSQCVLVDPARVGFVASPCAQNPTSVFFCEFAVRGDADFSAAAEKLRTIAADGEQCVTCSGTPCASYDCARPGTYRAVCDPATHRCERRPQAQ